MNPRLPVLNAMVLSTKLDGSFSQEAPGYSRETPSASWGSPDGPTKSAVYVMLRTEPEP